VCDLIYYSEFNAVHLQYFPLDWTEASGTVETNRNYIVGIGLQVVKSTESQT